MRELWTEWTPTTEQSKVWALSFSKCSPEDAWEALQKTYAKHGEWKTPSPVNFCEQLNVVSGPGPQGVHESEVQSTMSPLFVRQTLSLKPRSGQPRRSTWAFPGPLPGESEMMARAEREHAKMRYMHGGEWTICDTRIPHVEINPTDTPIPSYFKLYNIRRMQKIAEQERTGKD